MESKGVEVNALGLGGLWLITEFKCDTAGMPFEGRGLFGYDPAVKKHVGTWVDNTGYWQAVSSGTCPDGCKTVTSTFKGQGMDGKPAAFKEAVRQRWTPAAAPWTCSSRAGTRSGCSCWRSPAPAGSRVGDQRRKSAGFIPSFSSLESRVLGGRPARVAAPSVPVTLPLQRRMRFCR